MEPREVAELVMDRVVNYCEHNSGDIALECIADHSPDQLDTFIGSYLKGKEAEELERAIESSDTFWDDVKKEYEATWRSWLATKDAFNLSDEIYLTLFSIIDNPRLSSECKARRLKVYRDVLDKFGDAVLQALQSKKPLAKKDLYYWLSELGDVAFGSWDYDYNTDVDHYLNFYAEFNDNEKLDVLDILLNAIDDAMSTINEQLRELEALTNKS